MPRELYAGERLFQVRAGRSGAPLAGAMTPKEIAEWAKACARIDGWAKPCEGFFVLRSGTDQELRVGIGLMTEENIKAANVRIEDVDGAVVRERR